MLCHYPCGSHHDLLLIGPVYFALSDILGLQLWVFRISFESLDVNGVHRLVCITTFLFLLFFLALTPLLWPLTSILTSFLMMCSFSRTGTAEREASGCIESGF